MAEQRSEDADVEAASVTHADHGLGVDLVGDSDAGSEELPVGGGATVVTDAAVARDANHAFRQDRETAVAFAVHKFRSVVLPAQAIVDGQFVSRAPGILAVEEVSILSFYCLRLGSRSHIPIHVAHF